MENEAIVRKMEELAMRLFDEFKSNTETGKCPSR